MEENERDGRWKRRERDGGRKRWRVEEQERGIEDGRGMLVEEKEEKERGMERDRGWKRAHIHVYREEDV